MRDFDEWAASLIIVDEEAFLPGARVPRLTEAYPRSIRVPRPYRRLTDEERATYKRDWMRRKRAGIRAENPSRYVVVYASLHGLSCTGPTRPTGCRCRHKITLARRAA